MENGKANRPALFSRGFDNSVFMVLMCTLFGYFLHQLCTNAALRTSEIVQPLIIFFSSTFGAMTTYFFMKKTNGENGG